MLEISHLFKVKEGKLEKFLAWSNELSTVRREEALVSFSSEKVHREKCVLLKGNDGENYVIGVADKDEGGEVDMSLEVNLIHRKIREECLELVTHGGKILYDLFL